MSTPRARRLGAALALSVAGLALPGVAGTAGAAATSTTSTNWAGYAVTGATYKRVSGTWLQPQVDCSTATENAYSATWVGLGGYDTSSAALEQIGTEADCSSSGKASYSTWYELVPEAARNLALKTHAGDKMSASVTVTGRSVRMRLANLTTGRSVTRTRTTSNVDLTSAEWIQETPSVCDTTGNTCQVLPLANFGSVDFTNAYATTRGGHKGSISDTAWDATTIDLVESSGDRGEFPGRPRVVSDSADAGATTGTLDATGTAFTIGYSDGDTSTTATEPATRLARRAGSAVTRGAAHGGSTAAGALRWGGEQGA